MFECRWLPVAIRDNLRLSLIPDHGSLRFVVGLDFKPAVWDAGAGELHSEKACEVRREGESSGDDNEHETTETV